MNLRRWLVGRIFQHLDTFHGSCPYFRRGRGRILFLRLNFIRCKMGRMGVLASSYLSSRVVWGALLRKVNLGYFVNDRVMKKWGVLLKIGCRSTKSRKLKGIEGLKEHRWIWGNSLLLRDYMFICFVWGTRDISREPARQGRCPPRIGSGEWIDN